MKDSRRISSYFLFCWLHNSSPGRIHHDAKAPKITIKRSATFAILFLSRSRTSLHPHFMFATVFGVLCVITCYGRVSRATSASSEDAYRSIAYSGERARDCAKHVPSFLGQCQRFNDLANMCRCSEVLTQVEKMSYATSQHNYRDFS